MQPTGGASQYGGGDMIPPALNTAAHMFAADQSHQVVEAASPISSRPPASNLDEFLPGGGGGSGLPPDEDALAAGDEADRAGGSGGGGNRWPRQETLALLRIRSEMDATFRDATLKGPLWEDVSRKLAELGYKRSAKKCKEKFENVHKYYKRTKEGRAGRQDGKSYRFFSQLEALHATATPPATASPLPINVSPSPAIPSPPVAATNIFVSPSSTPAAMNPTPISSIRFSPMFSPNPGGSGNPEGGAASFSTNSASTSPMSEDEEEEDYNLSSRKRKRGEGSGTKRMMDFFEGLMKQVMQKQEAMQQRFLEAVEKREQDRMIREEAWKRQEMARLTGEHELMAQERAISASRDAAIISFLQKITGQTIHLPPQININPAVTPPQPPPPVPVTAPVAPPPPQQQHRPQPPASAPQPQQQVHQTQPPPIPQSQPQPVSTDVVMAVPEQQIPPQEMSGGGGSEPASSSRWPKAEVLALINLRSGLEPRYQEAGPKGPLWEEISAGMLRMGYKRSSKRCKEKWENINKYFKKVKESNKKRPEDAKTCPYFHQLDALYRRKILTSGGTSGSQIALEQHQQHQNQDQALKSDATQTPEPANKNGGGRTDAEQPISAANLFGESTPKKPEDIVKEMMMAQQRQRQQLMADDHYDKIEDGDSDDIEDEEDDEELEEARKMDYKIEFQRQNTSTTPSNGGGNGAPSFLAMVQ